MVAAINVKAGQGMKRHGMNALACQPVYAGCLFLILQVRIKWSTATWDEGKFRHQFGAQDLILLGIGGGLGCHIALPMLWIPWQKQKPCRSSHIQHLQAR